MSPCKWGAAAAEVSMDTGENLVTAFVYTTVLTYIGSEVAVGHVSCILLYYLINCIILPHFTTHCIAT